MRPLDWVVLVASLVSIVAYGLYRSRGSNTVDRYLLAGKTMPWYAMALSIMATQASAITFISTTGQSYVGWHALRAVLFRPAHRHDRDLAPRPCRSFHRARVYTAYEYLEKRFDAKTRALASVDLPVPARPLRGPHHLCSGHGALRDPGMAGARHHAR